MTVVSDDNNVVKHALAERLPPIKEYQRSEPGERWLRVGGGVAQMLSHIADDPSAEGIQETPARVANMWLNELTSGYHVDIESLFRLFPDEGYEGIVTVRDIPLCSTCEHHLLPIVGYCHVGYIPDGAVIGLSKLPRVVDAFARRLQIQERLTQQITDAIEQHLKPKGVIVVISAEHSCMTARGIQAPGTRAVTSAVTGKFRDPDETARAEFLNLVGVLNGHSG